MRVTICELSEEPQALTKEWARLAEHVQRQRSQMVVLPAMPFSAWFPARPEFEARVWDEAVLEHERWLLRLLDLAPVEVIGSRPMEWQGRRFHEGFIWSRQEGYRTAHHKVHLTNTDGFWEAAWYSPGEPHFKPVEAGGVQVGMLLGSELWAWEQARQFGQAAAEVIACPRASRDSGPHPWLVGGQAAAILSGAYVLSSNRRRANVGGAGFVIDPQGVALGLTSKRKPFVTVEIDLNAAGLGAPGCLGG